MLTVVDQQLKEQGCWHRFTQDGYGETKDGGPWNVPNPVRTYGRLWPLLSGERGEYELLVNQKASAAQRLKEIADRVLWLEDGEFRELAALATDPVCGMAVETGDVPRVELDGHTWWFCSTYCRDEFAARPQRFLERLPA